MTAEYAWHYAAQLMEGIWVKLGMGFLFSLLIPHQEALLILFALYLIDYGTGFAVGVKNKNVSSAAMRRGMVKLVLYMIVIVVTVLTEQVLQFTSGWITSGIVAVLVVTESFSIMENLLLLGLPMPLVAKFVSAIRRKAYAIGMPVPEFNTAMAQNRNEITAMVGVSIKRIQHQPLRRCMRSFYLAWFDALGNIDYSGLDGKIPIVKERLKHLVDNTSASACTKMHEITDHRFAGRFCTTLLPPFIQHMRARISDGRYTNNSPDIIMDEFLTALMLSLYRLLDAGKLWDARIAVGEEPEPVTPGSGGYKAIMTEMLAASGAQVIPSVDDRHASYDPRRFTTPLGGETAVPAEFFETPVKDNPTIDPDPGIVEPFKTDADCSDC